MGWALTRMSKLSQHRVKARCMAALYLLISNYKFSTTHSQKIRYEPDGFFTEIGPKVCGRLRRVLALSPVVHRDQKGDSNRGPVHDGSGSKPKLAW